MSIIYDALKKVEEKIGVSKAAAASATAAPPPAAKKPKPKFPIYFLYLLIGGVGVFIAYLAFGHFKVLAPNLKTKPQAIAKAPAPTTTVTVVPVAAQPQSQPPQGTPVESTSTPPSTPEEAKPLPPLVLNGIFLSQDGAYALVNNQIIRQGDTLEGMKVTQITEAEVQLDNNGQTVKLSNRK